MVAARCCCLVLCLAGLAPAAASDFDAGRSLTLAVEVDRDGAQLLAYTVKPEPFVSVPDTPPARAYDEGRPVQIELALRGPAGARYMRRVEVPSLCLSHPGDDPPHIEGDTIRPHRESFLVRLPEIAGFDRLELAYHERRRGALTRNTLLESPLERSRFSAAGGRISYDELLIANPGPAAPLATSAVTIRWPEQFGDTDIYRVYGDEAETERRINVVIVPDGYRYEDKALMETHADAIVAHLSAKTPYKEHAPFINYVLVYAYSTQAGTDECDCGVVLDTAMGTRFPNAGGSCGANQNRCLYYGSGCDTSGTTNIVQTELRAPAHDKTLVMVNTTRYGGCGGSRAVFAAGNISAAEIAVHELGHSLAGLADEYTSNSGCGSFGGEVNTSTDAVDGAWPEWVADLGAPREGARYYEQCIFRPQSNCEMRALNQPFCVVCNQHWSLVIFGHPRVQGTAPIASTHPSSALSPCLGVPANFSVGTRLSVGPGVTNAFTWTLEGPGFPTPTVVGSGSASHTQSFPQTGQYTLTSEVVADTNFVKPPRYGANRDSVDWILDVVPVGPPVEVPLPGSSEPLRFNASGTLGWEDTSAGCAATYNVYRGDLDNSGSGTCLQASLPTNSATVTQDPPPGGGWFYLVTGENVAGEGPLGDDSSGSARSVAAACSAP